MLFGVLNGFADLKMHDRLETDFVDFCLVIALLLNLVDLVLFLGLDDSAGADDTSMSFGDASFSVLSLTDCVSLSFASSVFNKLDSKH